MTPDRSLPLVSVITPVYNGEKYLASCIDSVLAQDYGHFELVLINNCSTDGSGDLMDRYAAADSRVRVHHFEELLPQIPNWNRAMTLMSDEACYCKVVHADDELLEGCLARMVDVAERNPSVDIVGAYRIDGAQVNMDSLQYPEERFDGSEVCRRRLLGEIGDIFGSPTNILYRAERVRERGERFYGLENAHADTEVCFELLKKGDYGFVYQTLTYTRRHEDTETAAMVDRESHSKGRLKIARDHGPDFLSAAEQRRAIDLQLRFYEQILATRPDRLADAAFAAETCALYESCGRRFSMPRIRVKGAGFALRQWLRPLARSLKRFARS